MEAPPYSTLDDVLPERRVTWHLFNSNSFLTLVARAEVCTLLSAILDLDNWFLICVCNYVNKREFSKVISVACLIAVN